MDICVDFDGTCVTHEYPEIGKEIGSKKVLQKLVLAGHNLILYTMRSAGELQQSINWFAVNNIILYGIQYNPTQAQWTTSNKCYANLYLDDAALGCPLKIDNSISKRPFVDWKKVEELLIEKGIL